ncbi:MAG TPA: hypothetical protein VF442_08350 [Sphingobium sp.]
MAGSQTKADPRAGTEAGMGGGASRSRAAVLRAASPVSVVEGFARYFIR